MDQFNKLDSYESRFSDQVWAGVSKHLEEQKKQKRIRRALYIGSTTIVMLSFLVGYYTLTDNAVERELIVSHQDKMVMLDSYGTASHNVETKNELTFHQEESRVSTREAQLKESNKNQEIRIEREMSDDVINDSRILNHKEKVNKQDFSLYQSTEVKKVVNQQENLQEFSNSKQTFVFDSPTSEVSRELVGANSPPQRDYESAPSRLLMEVDQLNQIRRLKSNQSIKSLFVKKGCNLLDASPFKTYAWSQVSAFAPVSNHGAKSSQYQEYNDARKSTESALISPEFGFGLGVKSKSGLFLESGFQFAYYREKLGYIDPESINVQTIITTDSVFVNGGVEVATDTTIIQIPGSREVVNYNSHKTVSIPIMFGFDRQLNSSWSLGGKIGTIFNLFKQTQGRILNEDMVIRDIIYNEGSNVEVYKTRLTTQFLLGSQLRYHFSPSLDVYLSGDIRFNAKSITLDDYGLSQRFTTPVLSAGMRYYF